MHGTGAGRLEYREIPVDEIDSIRTLWEELGAYHLPLSPRLRAHRMTRRFPERRDELVGKAATGKLRIEMVFPVKPQASPIGLCVSSVSHSFAGELDILYVQEAFRGRGIGAELVRRSMAWMDMQNAASRIVKVAHANESALSLYRRFGFCEEVVVMRWVP